MRNFRVLAAGLAFGSLALGGCVSGRPFSNAHPVTIVTAPEGATVTSQYGDSCVTPCDIWLPTADGGLLEVALLGYQTESVYIGSVFNSGRAARAMASEAALALAYPDPYDIGLELLLSAIDHRGRYSELTDYDVSLQLVPAIVDYAEAERNENAEPPPGIVYRLSDDEIAEILDGRPRRPPVMAASLPFGGHSE